MFDKKYDWTIFLAPADEWLVAYSLPPMLHFVKLSMVGQAVELYLKAVVAKQTGDVALALNQSHKVKEMWDLCKKNEQTFMPGYEIRPSVLNAGPKDVGLFAPEGIDPYSVLSEDDSKHYYANAELYAVAKLLPHLKYSPIPWKTFPNGFRVSWSFPNPYWIGFFKGLRSYLGVPLPGRLDYIKGIIGWDKLPAESVSYLSGLYE